MNITESIAIVIPIYNRIDVTKEGLKHIMNAIGFYKKSAVTPLNFTVVIVDDGSTDGSKEWIKLHYPEVVVLVGDGNLWWTGAVNLGISYALENEKHLKGVILQNDDVILEPDWLYNYVNAMNANTNALIGCATAVLEDKDVIIYGGRMLHSWFAKEEKINYKASKSNIGRNYTIPSFDLYGRGLYIPKAVFDKIGLFNQQRFKHRGDMDIPLRAKKAGFKLLVTYDAIVYELPQHAYNLDGKQRITLKEAFVLFTDFRSSYAIKHAYYYSLIATTNVLQFISFFIFSVYSNAKRIGWRLCKNYLLKTT